MPTIITCMYTPSHISLYYIYIIYHYISPFKEGFFFLRGSTTNKNIHIFCMFFSLKINAQLIFFTLPYFPLRDAFFRLQSCVVQIFFGSKTSARGGWSPLSIWSPVAFSNMAMLAMLGIFALAVLPVGGLTMTITSWNSMGLVKIIYLYMNGWNLWYM